MEPSRLPPLWSAGLCSVKRWSLGKGLLALDDSSDSFFSCAFFASGDVLKLCSSGRPTDPVYFTCGGVGALEDCLSFGG